MGDDDDVRNGNIVGWDKNTSWWKKVRVMNAKFIFQSVRIMRRVLHIILQLWRKTVSEREFAK